MNLEGDRTKLKDSRMNLEGDRTKLKHSEATKNLATKRKEAHKQH